MRLLLPSLLLALVIQGPPAGGAAADRGLAATDANLITALDISDSMMRHDEWIQFDGIARAVTDPAFLRAIAGGRHGRVGFAVFVWSSGRGGEVVLPWTLLASRADAEHIAADLRSTLEIDRSGYRRPDNDSDPKPPDQGLRTDVSGAIEFAVDMVAQAPYATDRKVINICANGVDNVSAHPDAARDRALAAGAIINGMVIGSRPDVAAYFRRHVQAGPGSFVVEARQPADVAAAMLDKFLRDLLAGRAGAGTGPEG